jgi:hypothetical protein
VRLVAHDAEGSGTIVKARYSCPAVYAFGVPVVFMEFTALGYQQYLAGALVPILWCMFHALSCLSYQAEKEKMSPRFATFYEYGNSKIQSPHAPLAALLASALNSFQFAGAVCAVDR